MTSFMTRLHCRRRPALVATAAVLGALVLSGCEAYDLPLPGSPVDKDESFEVTAEFNDVLQLVPRSPVKVNDVTVGEVTDIRRIGWHAEATLRIRDDVTLPGNVFADIRQTSLLGEKYVSLQPAEGAEQGRLEDGDTIGLQSTGRNPELEEVLGALAFLLNGGGVGQLKTITTEINKLFDGRQDSVRNVLRELRTLIGGLDEQKGDIIKAMEAMNGLTQTLNEEKRTVTGALDSFGPAVEVLADQHDQLMKMLTALDRLGAVGTRVINGTKENLLEDLRNLQPVLHEISRADETIPQALGLLISFPFPIESNDIVHGDYANTKITFEINLDNLFRNAQGEAPGGDGGGPLIPGLPDLPDIPGLPDLPGLPGGGGGGGLPDLPLLGRTNATSHDDTMATNMRELLGGGRA